MAAVGIMDATGRFFFTRGAQQFWTPIVYRLTTYIITYLCGTGHLREGEVGHCYVVNCRYLVYRHECSVVKAQQLVRYYGSYECGGKEVRGMAPTKASPCTPSIAIIDSKAEIYADRENVVVAR